MLREDLIHCSPHTKLVLTQNTNTAGGKHNLKVNAANKFTPAAPLSLPRYVTVLSPL